jgi:uncharacterized repeat protein (TIGR03803 family)
LFRNHEEKFMTGTTMSSTLGVARLIKGAFAIFAITLGLTTGAYSQTMQGIGSTGMIPEGLVIDSAGNLFGSISQSGSYSCLNDGCGQVIELSRGSSGWTTTDVYDFKGGSDGSNPGALVIGQDGSLYGATTSGGSTGCGSIGCGTIFQIAKTSGGEWVETLIHVFTEADARDGLYSGTPLVFDAKGNLYGTTGGGGNPTGCHGSCGVAFELSPNSDGTWTETVLYRFKSAATGIDPQGPLTLDAQGNLYGVMRGGGAFNCHRGGCGVIYELVHSTQGWTEKVLHTFYGPNGWWPNGGLVFDAAGNLYGTTIYGGAYDFGLAFKLSPASGEWQETPIHDFTGGNDGVLPTSGMVFDKHGNLYGTTMGGQPFVCEGSSACGEVFELSPVSSGWKISALYLVPQEYDPHGGLIFDPAGNLYGTAYDNHYETGGEVYELKP